MESWKGGCPKTPLWENDDSWQENANQKNVRNKLKQINVTRNRIIIDSFNDEDGENDGQSASDWLNNGIFLINLEDLERTMTDKEKISTLMKSLKGSLREAMFIKLRDLEDSKLTLQEFQKLFIAQTAKSTNELESRLNRITRENSKSLFGMQKRIKNIVEAQLQNAGIEKHSNNTKEVVDAIVDNHVRKKLHKNSELFQTSKKTGNDLIQLAKALDELNAARSVNTMKRENLQNEDKKSKQNQEQMTIQQHERWNNKETSGEGLRTNENPYRQNVQRNEHFTGRNEQYEGYNGQRYARRLPQTNWRQSGNWQRGGSCQDLRQRDNDGYQGYQNNPQWENQQDYYQQSKGRGNHERYNNGNRNTTTSWYDEQY